MFNVQNGSAYWFTNYCSLFQRGCRDCWLVNKPSGADNYFDCHHSTWVDCCARFDRVRVILTACPLRVTTGYYAVKKKAADHSRGDQNNHAVWSDPDLRLSERGSLLASNE